MAGDQGFTQVVLPVAQQVGDVAFQRRGVHLDLLAGLGADGDVQLRQRRFAQQHAAVDVLAAHGVLQQRLDAQAHVGVEALARDVDQRRIEAAVPVATQEQLAAHALLQAQDAHRRAVQLLVAGLEQFLAREGFQDMAQGLAAVAAGRKPGLLHHVFMALAHQRDLPRAAVVGAGGVQADEALLGDRVALGVELQHADVVHVARTVHGGAAVGLGEDQRVHRAALRQVVRGQRLDVARRRGVALAQQAQSAVLDGSQDARAFLHAVFAVAEEREVVGRRPAQELLRLAAAIIVHGHAAGGHVVGQGQHLLAHGRPVAHDGADFVQHAADALLDLRHLIRRKAVDLEQHQRLVPALAHGGDLAGPVAGEPHQRMPQHVHAHAHLGQRHAHRFDQEGHVVVDDLQHRVRRIPAMRLLRGIEHPDVRRARLADARESQHVGGDGGPAFGAMVGVLVLLHAHVEGFGESPRLCLGAGAGDALADRLQDGRQRERLTRRHPCLALRGLRRLHRSGRHLLGGGRLRGHRLGGLGGFRLGRFLRGFLGAAYSVHAESGSTSGSRMVIVSPATMTRLAARPHEHGLQMQRGFVWRCTGLAWNLLAPALHTMRWRMGPGLGRHAALTSWRACFAHRNTVKSRVSNF